jgi:hypothetical protein
VEYLPGFYTPTRLISFASWGTKSDNATYAGEFQIYAQFHRKRLPELPKKQQLVNTGLFFNISHCANSRVVCASTWYFLNELYFRSAAACQASIVYSTIHIYVTLSNTCLLTIRTLSHGVRFSSFFVVVHYCPFRTSQHLYSLTQP